MNLERELDEAILYGVQFEFLEVLKGEPLSKQDYEFIANKYHEYMFNTGQKDIAKHYSCLDLIENLRNIYK